MASKTLADAALRAVPPSVSRACGLSRAEDIPAALAAAEAAMGNKEQAAKDFAKVKDMRFKDVRFVAEGRLWPPKLVAGLSSLVGDAGATAAPAKP